MEEEIYVDLPVDTDGLLRSRVFPGLWLAVENLLAGNWSQVVAKLSLGLTCAEHREFQQSLAAKRSILKLQQFSKTLTPGRNV